MKGTRNPRFRAGIRYEEETLAHLERNLGRGFLPKQWICYQGEYRPYPAYCQVDALWIREEEGILFEVKYRHTPDAYFQIENVYLPVVKEVFPGVSFSIVEVVRWYDPSTSFPVPVKLCPDPAKALGTKDFNVHIFNRPKRKKGK